MKIIIKLVLVFIVFINFEVKAIYINANEINNKFKTEKYHIILNGNGGTFSKQDKIIVFNKHMTLPTPTKEGYIFSHYIINNNNSYTTEIDDINEINNKELIAKWKHKKYQILYELDGGKLEDAITEYTIDDEFPIPIPKKDNYIFLGWTTDNNETPNKEINICKGTTGDLYFKANWQEIKYHVKVISLIDNKIYNEGLEYFTFNVWINDILVEEEIINYEDYLLPNTKIRIKTNKKDGIETAYDQTIIINNDYEFNPEWTINEYNSEFYLDGKLAGITINKFNSKVSTPSIDINKFGYSKDFYYISGFKPRETWYQKAYTLYFDTNLEQYNCMASFGSRGLNNAYQQLSLLQQNGVKNCIVNESWYAVECYGKSKEILDLYNRVWNILPYSGNGYSRYKQMTCDSGYLTSYNR